MRHQLAAFFTPVNSLIITALSTSIVWALLVPIWHFPDEQAHFVQVQNTAETGGNPQGELDMSQEVLESERVLGTLRDERGNNQFTYNPHYRISYTPGNDGSREQQIKSLPKQAREVYLAKESPRYPPLFYWYSSVWYRLGYTADLFTRVLLVRLGSTILFVGIIYFALKISQELFPKQQNHALIVAAMTAFHPMLLFVSSGINNDTLITLLASAITLVCLRLVHLGISMKRMFALALLVALGMLTKQTIFLLFPLVAITCFIAYVKHRGSLKKVLLMVFVSIGVLSLTYALLKLLNQGFWLPYWPLSLKDMLASPALLPSLQGLLSRLYRETLPWYWGVFKWLGVVFPLPLIRVFKLSMVMSMVGWGFCVIKIASKKTRLENASLWLTLILGNAAYVTGLVAWELAAILRLGFGHGIQGRYFFPLIVSQMALLYFGWLQLIPKNVHTWFNRLLTLGLVALGIYSLWYVLGLYYSWQPFDVFTSQVSQYKAAIAKWPLVGIYGIVWLLTFGLASWQLLKKEEA